MSNEIQHLFHKRDLGHQTICVLFFVFCILLLGVKFAAKADKKPKFKCSYGKKNTVLKYKMRVYVLQFDSFYCTVEILLNNILRICNLKQRLLVYNRKSVLIVLQIRL